MWEGLEAQCRHDYLFELPPNGRTRRRPGSDSGVTFYVCVVLFCGDNCDVCRVHCVFLLLFGSLLEKVAVCLVFSFK